MQMEGMLGDLVIGVLLLSRPLEGRCGRSPEGAHTRGRRPSPAGARSSAALDHPKGLTGVWTPPATVHSLSLSLYIYIYI